MPSRALAERLRVKEFDEEPSFSISVTLHIGATRNQDRPFGPDFTREGTCDWDQWVSSAREALLKVGAVPDELLALADHQHRCRKCRDRIGGAVRDLLAMGAERR
jgi:hypothetical protein